MEVVKEDPKVEEAAKAAKKKGAKASADPLEEFIPPELMGDMEKAHDGNKGGDSFIPPELMGNMEHTAEGGDSFMPPELMGNMEVVAAQVAQKK